MNNKFSNIAKKTVIGLRIGFCAFACIFSITFFFINSDTVTRWLAGTLNLHVHPSFTGGKVLADFYDIKNTSGLLRYSVHEPVRDAKWQQNAEYWQLDLEYESAEDAEAATNTSLYISTDNELAIIVKNAEVYDSNGNFLCKCEIQKADSGKIVKIRIPLQNKEVQKVYGAKQTTHSVTGFNGQDSYSVDMTGKNGNIKVDVTQRIAQIKALYQSEAAPDGEPKTEFSTNEEAAKYYLKKIEENSKDAVSMAYYGSYCARIGGESSAMKALSLVNKAFLYLDKAVELARGTSDEIEVLMNRAGVCAAVPDVVFQKSQTGGEDYERIAELMSQNGATKQAAYYFVLAAECYHKAGNNTKVQLALQKAESMIQ